MRTEKKLSANLKRLMFEKDLKAMELARRTKLPQATVQRIMVGTTTNPHLSSLAPLAQYFGVSIAQLRGDEPISWFETVKAPPELIQIPLISLQQASNWAQIKEKVQNHPQMPMVWVENRLITEGFAITLPDTSMYPLFPKGSLIIVDPNRSPKDRSYVVVAFKDRPEVVFRQLLIDVNENYLKALSPELESAPMPIMQPGDMICGVLTQARKDYID